MVDVCRDLSSSKDQSEPLRWRLSGGMCADLTYSKSKLEAGLEW